MDATRFATAAAGLLVLVGCSDSAGVRGDGGPAVEDGAALGDEWTALIEGAWTIQPYSESYYCVRKTLESDILLRGFQALAPSGTHHTVLTIGSPSGPDGVVKCNSLTNHPGMIFGSGVGAAELLVPDGVGVRLPAGQQLLLNLHLFNVSDAELSGTSGTLMKSIDSAAVAEEAEAVLMGSVELEIPPGNHEEIGTCSFGDDATIFAVGPHMHQLGTHMTVWARRAAGDVMIHDGAYNFEDQQISPLAEQVVMESGDTIEVHCTYNNFTGDLVKFGESSNDEMCFAAVYSYPPASQRFGFICAN